MSKERRSVKENTLIGIAAGGIGGMTNAVVTHPLDTIKTLQQSNKSYKPKVIDYFKAYTSKDGWAGVGSSAWKKGLGFGIGLGATFAAESQMKKMLAQYRAKQELKKLGFHKAYDNI